MKSCIINFEPPESRLGLGHNMHMKHSFVKYMIFKPLSTNKVVA